MQSNNNNNNNSLLAAGRIFAGKLHKLDRLRDDPGLISNGPHKQRQLPQRRRDLFEYVRSELHKKVLRTLSILF